MLRSFFLLLPFTSTVFAHGPVELGFRTWHQDEDHPVHKLFKRESTDGVDYPDVGSPTWTSAYPTFSPDPSAMPQEWKDALAGAVSAGKIPDIPVTTVVNDWPTYPDGSDAGSPVICSSFVQCRGDGDIFDAPDGKIGIAFDDGPAAGTNKLVGFLSEQNETATHFLIGSNILAHPDEFLVIFNQGGDIAVHTWTHPHMTSMTNEQVMVELGWTMEIIHNSTGGRVPKYWRPPYGDCDNRVRAIAQQIFGMEAILWNHDTNDWSIGSDPSVTVDSVDASITGWLTGPKSPGLAILEHELTEDTVQAFMNAFPAMKENGWETESIALLASDTGNAYQNADGTGNDSTVLKAGILLSEEPASSAFFSSSSTTSSSSTSTSGSPTTSVSTRPSSADTNSALSLSFSRSAPCLMMLVLFFMLMPFY